jgi:hypothetical protein
MAVAVSRHRSLGNASLDWTVLRSELGLSIDVVAHWTGLPAERVRDVELGKGRGTEAGEVLGVLAGFLAGATTPSPAALVAHTRLADAVGASPDLQHVCPLPHGW